jgi:hypothetical protein
MPHENLLSKEFLNTKKAKKTKAKKKAKPRAKKARNYSFRESKRLPIDKMTEVHGVKIPSIPGSCYHAIISALAESKDKFCNWDKVIDATHRNMRMYGGQNAWEKFVSKSNVKSPKQRIKDNAHTLTRTGRDCYGYRLHELGMCIYFYKDGAMLLTGGQLKQTGDAYDVIFPDGHRLQTRYRGTTMTYREYCCFLDKKYIDKTGKILNAKGIKKMRAKEPNLHSSDPPEELHVCVTLEDTFDQNTAHRLESLGLKVEEGLNNELLGFILRNRLEILQKDVDVKEVEVSGD